MRENRPYGSEGGEGQTLPDPYHHGVSDDSNGIHWRRDTIMPAKPIEDRLRWPMMVIADRKSHICFSKVSALDVSALPGASSTLSLVTTPFSTSIE